MTKSISPHRGHLLRGYRQLALLTLLLQLTACDHHPLADAASTAVPLTASGHLLPCPQRPNCVSSEETSSSAAITPLAIQKDASQSWLALQQAIELAGGQLQRVSATNLHATFRSPVFRFVDDLHCRLDSAQQLIHLRSASRLGYSDLGVNRRRLERIRRHYQQLTESPQQ